MLDGSMSSPLKYRTDIYPVPILVIIVPEVVPFTNMVLL